MRVDTKAALLTGYKLTSREQRVADTLVPRAVTRIDNEGGIMPLTPMLSAYGLTVVRRLLDRGMVRRVLVNRRDKDNARPDEQIDALATDRWSGDQPKWLV